MRKWTRREVLKSGVAVSAGVTSAIPTTAATLSSQTPAAVQPGDNPSSTRERLLLDFGWRFHLGHACDPGQDFGFGGDGVFSKSGELFEPSRDKFDDSKWRVIDLPHDWAVELEFENDPGIVNHGFKPLDRTYPATSIGWYRRAFEIPKSDLGKRLSIEFDGVFRDSMVVLNGHFLGRNMSGYAPCFYDVTDFLNYGAKNILVVRVDATQGEGWFYEGAGIYRHVWLTKADPLHIAHWGTFVWSQVHGAAAVVWISTEVENQSAEPRVFNVISRFVDKDGNVAAAVETQSMQADPWTNLTLVAKTEVQHPLLWSLEERNLYRALTTVEDANNRRATDQYATTFGIRTIKFDADEGFFLNGKPVKIKGTCNHQDHAGVGSALPDRIQYYRIEKLKEMGVNGYRTSHNPPTPELLDACDQLGMLVMDETRRMSSDPGALSDLKKMIRRDRNHPSVILWSLGNEEPEQGTERGARIVTTMKRLVRRLDPSRPVSVAMDDAWGRGVSGVVDVQGFNYKHGPEIDDFHQRFPTQPMIGTEVGSTVSTRGIYANDKEQGYVSAYDENFPEWAATAEEWWKIYAERRFLAGGFVWTGFDYRGEPTPYEWPCINSHFGIIDTCGFPKDNYYYYQAWWSERPVLHLFPHWNWPGKEGQEIDVWCHSNLEKVELFLNGGSLGVKEVPRYSHVAWKVRYKPGTLEARGYRGGQQVLVARQETAGGAAKILLRPDRQEILADGQDVSLVEVRVLDKEDRIVPVADNEIMFKLSGTGKVIGVGNGDPSSHEPDKNHKRRAFNGLCMVIVQSSKEPGEIRLEASSPGLEPATSVIECVKVTLRPALA
ncbi:MAG: beta-galactosidase GalA [Terriglobia bacterium]|jgi:beta-galactosidase